MKEQTTGFVPLKPTSQEVRDFLEQEPAADWKRSLLFLLDRFPQIRDGKTEYLIEGGAAVALLGHPRGKAPKDIDLLTSRPDLPAAFQNSEKFDVKTVEHWFEERGLTYTPERGAFLLGSSETVQHEGVNVLVLSPVLLACSKLLEFRGRKPRLQDQNDVSFLGASPEDIHAAMERLGAL